MLAVVFYVSCIGLTVTLSLIAPIFVGLLANEYEVAARLAFYLLIGVFVFGGPILAIIGRLRRIPRIARLVLLVMAWTVLPLAAAVVIEDLSDLNFLDSLFEAVSGLTTAGTSLFKTVDPLPQAFIFLRVQLQWLGGYLALVTIMTIVAPMGIGGLVSRTGSLAAGADLRAQDWRMLSFALNLGLFYVTMTALCFLGFFLSGTRAFYAVTLAMTATSTGGFLPFDASLDRVLGTFGIFVFGLFLLLGATSVLWQSMVLRRKRTNLSRHRESYSVILLTLAITLAFVISAVVFAASAHGGAVYIVVEAFMNAASLIATSGVETRPGYFTLLPLVAVLCIVFLGGSAFSTSGGLKHYRMGGMLVQSWSELDRLVYPSGVRASRFGSEYYDIQLMKAIWSFFVVAILVIGFGTLFVATSGMPFEAALTATIAGFSTAGPVYNSGWAQPGTEAWPAYTEFSPFAKSTLIVVMIAGRVEVLAILGLFSVRYWRTR